MILSRTVLTQPRRTDVLASLLLVLGTVLIWRAFFEQRSPAEQLKIPDGATVSSSTASIAIVCCAQRSEETLVLLKSIFLFSQDENVEVFVIADDICGPALADGVELLRSQVTGQFSNNVKVTLIPYEVPPGTEDWQVQEKWICTPSRLFLHQLLPQTDAVLYLDTDHIFLSNVTEVWKYFENEQRSNPFVVVSLADHVPAPANYTYQFRDIPFAGNGGINAGTIFMNLTRMRAFQFERLVFKTYEQYNGIFDGGVDQDIINIIFGTHRDNATIVECNYSLHPEHCGDEEHKCMYHNVQDGPVCFCWPAITGGVKLIHGLAGSFHSDGYLQIPFMASLFDAFQNAPLDSMAMLDSIQKLKQDFTSLLNQPPCFALTPEALYGNAEKYMVKITIRDSEDLAGDIVGR